MIGQYGSLASSLLKGDALFLLLDVTESRDDGVREWPAVEPFSFADCDPDPCIPDNPAVAVCDRGMSFSYSSRLSSKLIESMFGRLVLFDSRRLE